MHKKFRENQYQDKLLLKDSVDPVFSLAMLNHGRTDKEAHTILQYKPDADLYRYFKSEGLAKKRAFLEERLKSQEMKTYLSLRIKRELENRVSNKTYLTLKKDVNYINCVNSIDKEMVQDYKKFLTMRDRYSGTGVDQREEKAFYDFLEQNLRTDLIQRVLDAKEQIDEDRKLRIESRRKYQENLHRMRRFGANLLEEKRSMLIRHGSHPHLKPNTKDPLIVSNSKLPNAENEKGYLFGDDRTVRKKTLGDIIVQYPKNFKTSNTQFMKKQVWKPVAGLSVNHLDELSDEAKNAVEQNMKEQFMSNEQKGIVDLCMNYKRRNFHPEVVKSKVVRTKQSIHTNIVRLERELKDLDNAEKKQFRLKKHKSMNNIARM
jgi:hypothetical protein